MKNTVLMVIDIQNAGINNRPANKEQFIENVVQLIDCARSNDLEVIHVRQNNPPGGILETGIPGWEIYHEVAPVNDEIIKEPKTIIDDSFLQDGVIMLRKGKKKFHQIKMK